MPVGGPDVLSQNESAEAAFKALGKPAKITHLPDILRRSALKLLPYITPVAVHGPELFFLSALGMNMVGKTHSKKTIADHFAQLVGTKSAILEPKGMSQLKTQSAS